LLRETILSSTSYLLLKMACRFLRSRSASSSPAGSSCESMLPCEKTPSPPAVPAPPAPRPRGVPPMAIEAAIIAELFRGEAIRTPVGGSRLGLSIPRRFHGLFVPAVIERDLRT
jgi:hypothetical protein